MGSMTDVSALVAQMQETLGTIHATLASLDTAAQDEKLDDLEKKRDDAVRALSAAFSAESEALHRKRQVEREVIAERRRKEDEERDRIRREEDELLAAREREEDEARGGKLKEETEEMEHETDSLMSQAEEDARAAMAEGYERLRALQEKRRELNRQIEEQMELSLPTIPATPTRTRRAVKTGAFPPPVFGESHQPELAPAAGVSDNRDLKPSESQDTIQKQEGPRRLSGAALEPEQGDKHEAAPHVDESTQMQYGAALEPEQGNTREVADVRQEFPTDTVDSESGQPPHGEVQLDRAGPEHYFIDDLATAPVPTEVRPTPSPDVQRLEQRAQEESELEVTEADETEADASSARGVLGEDGAAEEHQTRDIPGTMSHGADSPATQEVDFRTGLKADNVEVTAAVVEGSPEQGGPLPSKDTSMSAANSPTTQVGKGIEAEELEHHPEETTEVSTAPHTLYEVDSNDDEDSPRLSPTALRSLDDNPYERGSETSGPAPPHDTDDESSLPANGYLFEDVDIEDDVFNNPGESFIEETERLGINVQGEEGPVNTTDPTADVEVGTESDESVTRPSIKRLPLSAVALETDNAPHPSEDTKDTNIREEDKTEPHPQEPPHPASIQGEDKDESDSSSVQSVSNHEAKPADDTQSDQAHSDADSQESAIDPFQHAAKPYDDDHGALSEPEEYADDGSERQEDEEHLLGNRAASNQSQAHGLSPEPGYDGYGYGEPGGYEEPGTAEQPVPGGSQSGYHSADQQASEDDYTDSESQRFVTPLPSYQSLRASGERQHETNPFRHAGIHAAQQQHPEDSARQYELGDHHTTTVHGQEELFDYDSRSEGPTSSFGGGAATAEESGSDQGTPPLPAGAAGMGQEIPDVQVDAPKPPLNRGRSWVEEVGGYFEDETEPETPQARSKLPSPQLNQTGQHLGDPDTSWVELGDEDDTPSAASKILAESTHNDRPQTPTKRESLTGSEYATPENQATRGVTNVPSHADDGWTPQSQRTLRTLSTTPPSPTQIMPHTAKHEPEINNNIPDSPTYSEPPRTHSPLPQLHSLEEEEEAPEPNTPANRTGLWQRKESGSPTADTRFSSHERGEGSGSGGSLFQRMRSIFEQPHRRGSTPGSKSGSRPSSGITSPTTQQRFSSVSSPAGGLGQQQQFAGEDEGSGLLGGPH